MQKLLKLGTKAWRAACTTDGTLTKTIGFVAGVSGTGSCTNSDTSLYTFTLPKTLKYEPQVIVHMETAERAWMVESISTSAVAIRTTAVDGTTKTTCAFRILVIGN